MEVSSTNNACHGTGKFVKKFLSLRNSLRDEFNTKIIALSTQIFFSIASTAVIHLHTLSWHIKTVNSSTPEVYNIRKNLYNTSRKTYSVLFGAMIENYYFLCSTLPLVCAFYAQHCPLCVHSMLNTAPCVCILCSTLPLVCAFFKCR